MRAVVIRKDQAKERAPTFTEICAVRCEGCGGEFTVFHDPSFTTRLSRTAARRRGKRDGLKRVLTEEYEREQKHPNRVHLPD